LRQQGKAREQILDQQREEIRTLRLDCARLASQVAELRTNRALEAAKAASSPRLVN